jgi:hypothetical protein
MPKAGWLHLGSPFIGIPLPSGTVFDHGVPVGISYKICYVEDRKAYRINYGGMPDVRS